MGILERKEREKAKRRELIKKCAKELILENTAAQVSMADIAEKAELSKATLYLYFVNKEALFLEIFNESTVNFTNRVCSRLKPSMSCIDTLKIIWGSYKELFGESEDIMVIFSISNYIEPNIPFLQIEEDSGMSKNTSGIFYSMISDAIKKGIDEAIFDPTINPQTVGKTLIVLFSSIVNSAAKLPKTARKSQFILGEMENTFKIILRGIAKEGADPLYFSFLK